MRVPAIRMWLRSTGKFSLSVFIKKGRKQSKPLKQEVRKMQNKLK